MIFTETDQIKIVQAKEGIPKYKLISALICQKISEGVLSVGDRLPSQRALAEFFSVNRSTIVEAMDELKSFGIIDGNFGNGTRISNSTWALMMAMEKSNWNALVKSGPFKANKATIQAINRLEFEEGIIRLGTGEFAQELFPQDMMRKVLNKVSDRYESLNYLEPLGLLELRRALCDHLFRYGIETTPDNILIVSGSIQALQLISISMLKPGTSVLMEDPSYLNSLQIFQSAGMLLTGIPMDSHGIKVKSFNYQASRIKNPILYTIPCFQNPTGTEMSLARRKELVEAATAQHIPIIEDDCYRDLWFDKEPPPPLKVLDGSDSILYLGSISKSLSPGFRLGWIVGPKPVVERLGDVKMQIDYGASSVSQWILTEWLESGLYYEHLEILRPKLKARRDLVLRLLEEHFKDLADWEIPSGGFYVWIKLKKSINMDALFLKALENKLLINPGNMYEFEKKCCIRISYSYAPVEQYHFGIPQLAKVITNLIDS